MLRKFPIFKLEQIKSCIKRFTQKNYAYVRNVENGNSNDANFKFSCRNYKRLNPIYQYDRIKPNIILQALKKRKDAFKNAGLLLSTVTALGTIWHNSTQEDVENNLAHIMQLAKLALENGDGERAEAILKLGLKISEEHKLFTVIPFIYDVLATISLNNGRLEDAEMYLVEAIEKLSTLGYPDNNHNIIDFRLRLARMYSTAGYKTLAEIGFQNCLNQQISKVQDGDFSEKTGLLYINILFWYGIHKIRNERFTEARQLVKNAYEYSTKIKGLSPKQEMVILYTLSDVNKELGDYEIALTSMLDAIVLGKGIGSADLPLCYLKLGHLYVKLEMTDRARACYEEAKTQAHLFGYGEVVAEAITALALMNNSVR